MPAALQLSYKQSYKVLNSADKVTFWLRNYQSISEIWKYQP